MAQSPDPIAALSQRADDYAPGDTDLAWTRSTPWRSLLAGALDTVSSPVVGVTISAAADDPTAALMRGWLQTRLGVTPTTRAEGHHIESVGLRLATGEEITVARSDEGAILIRTGQADRPLPLVRRQLGDQLAEELRRLDADQPYADALAVATDRAGLSSRPASRVHIWHDPQPSPN